jgi:uncharacterized protein (DUF983 family)
MLTIQSQPDLSHGREESKPSMILQLVKCKCPRCRLGNMFLEKNPWKLKKTMEMMETCSICGQSFNPEVGFYFGSSYISYALTVALSVATFTAFWICAGFPFYQENIIWWLVINAALLISLQPYIMRLARTGWLSFFVRYDASWRMHPPVEPERTNKDQENNW